MRRLALFLAALSLLALAPAAGAQTRPRGDVRLLAQVPSPGYPAMAHVHPNGRIYVGTYLNPSGSTQPSRVFEYTEGGNLSRSWSVPGQDLGADNGIQVATSDAQGRLVLLDRTPSRALKLDRGTGEFTNYSTFADLSPCPAGQARTDCSPTVQNLPPAANYGAWGPDGSLYVTDYQQGVLWRVPPGGGPARVWLSDRRLDGAQFGTTGIMLGPDRRTLYVAQGSSGGLAALNPASGKLYAVPIQPNGQPGAIRELWESGPAELPDGFAIGRSGRFYMPLAGTNAIAVIDPSGREVERFTSDRFDTPSSARFLGTKIIVPNQAFVGGDPARQTLLDVETRESGLPELIPGLDRTAPRLSRVSLSRKKLGRRKGRKATRVRFRVNERSVVSYRVEWLRTRGRLRLMRTFNRRAKVGRNSVIVRRGRLKRGRYRVVMRARDAANNASPRVKRRFRIAR